MAIRILLSIALLLTLNTHLSQAKEPDCYKENPFALAGSAGGALAAGKYKQAYDIYTTMKDCDDVSGYLGLAEMNEKGLGIEKNYKIAAAYYRIAAERGNAFSALRLASMYAYGRGVLQNYITAHFLANLAGLYSEASGTEQDASNLLAYLSRKMTPTQLEDAQALARECVKKHPSNYGDEFGECIKKSGN
jgi:TPR repeat protein